MNKQTLDEGNEDPLTGTFKILDRSTNIEINITPIHMISLHSLLPSIPTQTSLDSPQSLLSELSNDKSEQSALEPIMHIFKSSKKLRRDCYWLCELKFKVDDKFNHWGAMFPLSNAEDDIGDNEQNKDGGRDEAGCYFGVFKVKEPILEDKNADETYHFANEQDLTAIDEFSLNEKEEELQTSETSESIEPFSMQPPTRPQNDSSKNGLVSHADSSSTFLSPTKREDSQDPLQFLTNRYYHSLYSLNEPLSYFSKTSLPRFKNLCEGNDSLILTILDSLILNMDKFDLRYDGKSNGELFASEASSSSGCEFQHREKFRQRVGFSVKRNVEGDGKEDSVNSGVGSLHLDGIDNEKLQRLTLELKVREAQLQIILLFEAFQLWNIDEDEFLKQNLQKQNELMKESQDQLKASLVRARKRRRTNTKKSTNGHQEKKESKRVKPITLSGPESSNEMSNRGFAYYLYLNKLIDRLNLWEVLMVPDKHGMQGGRNVVANGNSGGSSSSYGFLAYVLVPYYGKTLPLLMKYVIRNMKNTNMELTSKVKKKSHSKKRTSSRTSSATDISAGSDKTPIEDGTNKEDGVGEEKESKVKRKSIVSSDNNDTLIKDISIASLKRSKSNLGGQSSRELLDKRQVDLNFKPPQLKKQLSSNLDNGGAILSTNSSSSLIFGKARRSRTLPRVGSTSEITPSMNVAQTPMKGGREVVPNGTSISDSSRDLMMPFSQVDATPAKQRVVDLEIFTPARKHHALESPVSSTMKKQAPNSIFTSPASANDASTFLKPASGSMAQRLQSVALGIVPDAAKTTYLQEETSSVAFTPKKRSTDQTVTMPRDSPHDLIVEATPQRNQHNTPQSKAPPYISIVESTPVQSSAKLSALSKDTADTVVQATPQQQRSPQQHIQTPIIKHNQESQFKSPIALQKNGKFSSPSVQKTKPGDPVAINESPIYNAYATTGLLSLRGKSTAEEVSDDEGDAAYDSDEILNPKKRKMRATYSRR
ncbi:hypothetical protein KGF57_000013 [Candida theae]|uniref:DNA replication regulator Sld3 C-terminal domain-containing protein n=1 Tax=Candida theae TaxID=1198502 RepID=A0AAD5G1I1_9ASCO|nr:uncharacterized protein KGF57_000013 [Candida theae]KAI5968898.1 hypothetical protein KGF57_000013 [Candida theae]